MAEESGQSRKEKPHAVRLAEKSILSETEHDLVVRIPLVVRLGPVVVEPHAVIVVVEVEHVRIAVRVGDLRDTPSETLPAQNGAWLYSMCDQKSPEAYRTKYFFFETKYISTAESHSRPRSQYPFVRVAPNSRNRLVLTNLI